MRTPGSYCPGLAVSQGSTAATLTTAGTQPSQAMATTPAPVLATAQAKMDRSDDFFLQSVVVIHSTKVLPDFASPWHKENPRQSQGSGFVISDPRAPERGRLLLTNAHVVDYSTEIFVQKYLSDERVRASVLRLIPDCDVAILAVKDEDFWGGDGERLPPLHFGAMPKIQDVVRVCGYPEHGTEVAVTSGSVCRIQHQEYSHSEVELLSLETTALIAHGNSGGPVLNESGQVVGIAFQGTDRVGEFIPYCVFSRFLQVDEHIKMGEIQTVAGLSFQWQKLENKAIRRSLGLDSMEGNSRSGIYVTHVDTFGAVKGVLELGDVIVEVESVNVGNLGTVIIEGNRIGFMHLVTSRAVGDVLHVGIVRKGVRLDVEWILSSADSSYLVPKYDRLKMRGLMPDYMVIGGLVFCRFSKQLFNSLAGSNTYLYHLVDALDFGMKDLEDDEYVILSRLLPNVVVEGYEPGEVESRRVETLNGTKVRSLQHFAELYEGCEGEFLRIDLSRPCFPTASTLILDRKMIADEEKNILEEYQVPAWCRLAGSIEDTTTASAVSDASGSVSDADSRVNASVDVNTNAVDSNEKKGDAMAGAEGLSCSRSCSCAYCETVLCAKCGSVAVTDGNSSEERATKESDQN